MKSRVLVAVYGLGLLAAVCQAADDHRVRINLDETPQTPAPAKPTAGTKAEPGKTTPPAAPGASSSKKAAPTKGKKADGAPKPAEPPQIEGMIVARGDKGFMAIKVDGGFRISFYDRDKMPVAPDISQVVLRWPVHYQPNDERAFLTPAGDNVLSSPKVVRPPYTFKLFITLLKNVPDGNPEAVENYVVDFNQA